MSTKKKYPQSFYDDGLGDILEWIDDEVLVHKNEKRAKSGNKRSTVFTSDESCAKRSKNDIKDRQPKLYGDNDLQEVLYRKTKSLGNLDGPADETKISSSRKSNKNLEDQVRGLLNRLAAQTMTYVSTEFKKLYEINPRSDLNILVFQNIERSILVESSLAKRKLVAELMLLVAYLDSTISHNIGATIIHKLVKKFETLYRDGNRDDTKIMNNIIFCMVNLYTIGIISANLIFELSKRICSPDEFRPKSIELLLIILKNVGFQLRKDKPSLMRQLIIMSHEQCKHFGKSSDVESRIQFMLEALNAIKNNNMSKLGNYGCDIEKDTIESTLKALVKRTKLPEPLNEATYEEVLSSSSWYLIETRLDDSNRTNIDDDTLTLSNDKKVSTSSNKTEVKICKALGLNKPAERAIFSTLLKVSDFVEASNIIIGYGLNHCSDAMVVVIHVAIHEKKYNGFYFDVINNLCKFNRKYKMAAKFAIQDKIRVLSDMTSQRVTILGKLCLELIRSDAIPITVLKAIEWANLGDSTKQFLTYVLQSISVLNEEDKRKIMVKSDRKSAFAGAMRTFTNCFLKECDLFE